MRLGRIAIRLIAVLGMLAILVMPAASRSAAAAPSPQIKVTPQAGSNQVIFLVTGVGFMPPAVTGTLYLQVIAQATGQAIPFSDPSNPDPSAAVVTATSEGLLVSTLTFGGALPDGPYQARIASAEFGGTVYATYDMKLDSTLPVAPAVSVTPTSGPPGSSDEGGTTFILAGTSLTPGGVYILGIVSTDGYTVVSFGDTVADNAVTADEDGIVLTTLNFNQDLPAGDYVAGLLTLDQQVVAKTNFTIAPPAARPNTTKPELKVTPQTGANTVNFVLTGVGFSPPNVNGRIYFQVQAQSTEEYLQFDNPVVSPTPEGLVASVIGFDSNLPNGTYIARVASAVTGGTAYASYTFKIDSAAQSRPTISITPTFGPAGDPAAGGTIFILAGTGLTPNATYAFAVVSADGTLEVDFGPDATVTADGDGVVLTTLIFDSTLPNGSYIARLLTGAGAVAAEATFGLGTSAPSPGPSASPTPSPSTIPSPPPTGNGGNLPGLPNTGGGGAVTTAPANPGLGLLAGGAVVVALVTVGSALRRRRAA